MNTFVFAWSAQGADVASQIANRMIGVSLGRRGVRVDAVLGTNAAAAWLLDETRAPHPTVLEMGADARLFLPFDFESGQAHVRTSAPSDCVGSWNQIETGPWGASITADPVQLHHTILASGSDWFVAGSEIRQVLASGLVNTAIDWGILGERLSGGQVTGQRTVYRDISTLRAGSIATYKRGGSITSTHWKEWPAGPDLKPSDNEWIVELRDTIRTSTQGCLVAPSAAAPLGLALSGGLDSSGLAGLLLELNLATSTLAMTQRFPGLDCDESDFQDAVLAQTGMDEVSTSSTPFSIQRDIFDRTSEFRVPVFRPDHDADALYEAGSARGIGRVLSGHGGDDVLAPYQLLLSQTIAQRRWADARTIVAHNRRKRLVWRMLVHSIERSAGLTVPKAVRARLRSPIPAWIEPDFARQINLQDRLLTKQPGAGSLSSFRERKDDLLFNGSSDMGREVMAVQRARYGVSLLMPFLSSAMIDLALRIPDDVRWASDDSRFLQREAMKPWLAQPIRQRRGKVNFDHRYGASLDDEAVEELLNSLRLEAMGAIDGNSLRELWRRVVVPLRSDPNAVTPGSVVLWNIIGLEAWFRNLN